MRTIPRNQVGTIFLLEILRTREEALGKFTFCILNNLLVIYQVTLINKVDFPFTFSQKPGLIIHSNDKFLSRDPSPFPKHHQTLHHP